MSLLDVRCKKKLFCINVRMVQPRLRKACQRIDVLRAPSVLTIENVLTALSAAMASVSILRSAASPRIVQTVRSVVKIGAWTGPNASTIRTVRRAQHVLTSAASSWPSAE